MGSERKPPSGTIVKGNTLASLYKKEREWIFAYNIIGPADEMPRYKEAAELGHVETAVVFTGEGADLITPKE